METITQSVILDNGYYTGFRIFDILTRPLHVMVLQYIEQNPGCNTFKIYTDVASHLTRCRTPQVVKELADIGLITIKIVGKARLAYLNTERLQQINDSITRLL